MTQPGWAYPPPGQPCGSFGQPGGSFGQPTGPVHLPSLAEDERTDLLAQMRDWVAQLVTRFHIDARVIPPCWERHNGILEALCALRDLERDCFHDKAPPGAGVDWFRGFREIEARLIELASLTSCTAREHRDPPQAGPRHRTPQRVCRRPPAPDLDRAGHDDDPNGRAAGGAPPVEVT